MNDSFDNKIKEALENFEMPYDANAWAELEKQLPSTPPAAAPASKSIWKWVAGAALVIAAAAIVIVSNKETEFTKETTSSNEQPEIVPQAVQSVAETTTPAADLEPSSNTRMSESVPSDEEKRVIKAESTENTIEPVAEQSAKQQTNEAENNSVESAVISGSDIAEVEEDNEVRENLTVDFELSKSVTCANEDVNFIVDLSSDDAELVWDFGDGTTSSDKNPSHSYINEGTYTVRLTASGKSSSAEKTREVVVRPTPTPVMSSERKLNGYEAIPLYVFTTATQPNQTAIWNFSDGTRAEGNSATHLFRNSGEQKATLTVINQYGCSMSMDRKYQLDKFNLLAPTAFTPDGDGINETFIPKALPEMGLEFEMTVQDPKTGQLVYRTEDASAPWNGTMNNSGVELENGIYIWTVVLKDNVVKNRVFTETINLQR